MTRTDADAKSEEIERDHITDGDGAVVDSALVGDGLELSYPSSDGTVVECARLDVPESAVTALVGPNGSGKSTLLKALSNHLTPASGSVRIHGEDLDSFGRKELARKLGVLSQENDSLGSITVEDLVYHGRYPHRGFFDSPDETDRGAVERALAMAGI